MDTERHRLAQRIARLPDDRRRLLLDALAQKGIDFRDLPIVPAEAGGRRPLSFAQDRLWLIGQLGEDAALLHIVGGYRLSGPLDRPALARALAALSLRHEALRTGFGDDRDGVRARIDPAARVVLDEADLGALPEAEAEAALAALSAEEARRPFDLARAPLMRATLVRLGGERHVLLLTLHHLVADGRSVEILAHELAALYGGAGDLPPLPVQYTDYALWQRDSLAGGALDPQLAWWRDRLGTGDPLLALPLDRPRPAVQSFRGAARGLALDPAAVASLRTLAAAAGITPATVLLAGFAVLLHRLTGTHDLRVGVPAAGRTRPETEGVVGLFVNTLVIRIPVAGAQGFSGLLASVRDAMLDAQARQDLPFDRLVEALRPERGVSHAPLVQVVHSHRAPAPGPAGWPGLAAEAFGRETGAVQFDLVLETAEEPDGRIACTFGYARDLFQDATVARFASAYRSLLEQALAAPE
ncbi:condensation domain-containing protein, partial [Methylobacterium crusticola]